MKEQSLPNVTSEPLYVSGRAADRTYRHPAGGVHGLDYVTILKLVLPSIEADLGAAPATLEWMLAGYTLALALGLISGARPGDLLGHKRVFLAGMTGFVAASALCGAALDPGTLVVARVPRGLFAAAMIPRALSQIQLMYASGAGPTVAAFSSDRVTC